MKVSAQHGDVKKRLYARLDRQGGANSCWPWMGTKTPDGYGKMSLSGIVTYTHRLSYTLANGPIPDGMYILHACDNPPCCNPSHLRIGTHADNIADRIAKGRSASGSSHGRAKLSEDDVNDIRARYSAGGVLQRELAKQYGVSTTTINKIVLRVTRVNG